MTMAKARPQSKTTNTPPVQKKQTNKKTNKKKTNKKRSSTVTMAGLAAGEKQIFVIEQKTKPKRRTGRRERTDAVDAERVELDVFGARRAEAAADLARVLPPLVVEQLDDALLLQRQDGQRDAVAPRRADRRRDAVVLGVDQSADLSASIAMDSAPEFISKFSPWNMQPLYLYRL